MIGLPDIGESEHLLPELVIVSPSKVNPWRGGRMPTERYTEKQLAALRARNIDPATVEDIIIRDPATSREMWWPTPGPRPHFVMPCPITERHAGGRLTVLSPSGDEMNVGPDGARAASFSWKVGGRRRG